MCLCSNLDMPNICTPDWAGLLREMVATGMSQAQVAKAVDLSQPSVSDLINGHVKATEYTRGLRILQAHKEAIRRAKRKPAKTTA